MMFYIFLICVFEIFATEPCPFLIPEMDHEAIRTELKSPTPDIMTLVRDQLNLRLVKADGVLSTTELHFFDNIISTLRLPVKLRYQKNVIEERMWWECKKFELQLGLVTSQKPLQYPRGYEQLQFVINKLNDPDSPNIIDKVHSIRSYLYMNKDKISAGAAAFILVQLDLLPVKDVSAAGFLMEYKHIALLLDRIIATAQ